MPCNRRSERLFGPQGGDDVGVNRGPHRWSSGSASRNAAIHALICLALEKAGRAPTYFTKGFSAGRAGRIVVRSSSTTNSTRSPSLSPRRLRISSGTVIWPLLLMVLVRPIFTSLLYSKDTTDYPVLAAASKTRCF